MYGATGLQDCIMNEVSSFHVALNLHEREAHTTSRLD